jgi:flagellar motility protein MotE (MotC chaperone)
MVQKTITLIFSKSIWHTGIKNINVFKKFMRSIMKNKYFILTIFLLFAGSVYTSCENNRENAKDDVKQANQAMIEAQAQFEKEWQQFRNDAELKIEANQKKIDDFNEAMKATSEKFKAKYENEVLTLEQNNIELKKNLNNYKYEGKDNWENFKKRFNNDVDSIEIAISGLFKEKD